MIKRALPVLFGLLALCAPLLAQEDRLISRDELRLTGEPDVAPALALFRPDLFRSVDGRLLLHDLPVLTLLDGRRFPISGNSGSFGVAPLERIPLAFLQSVRVHGIGSSPFYGSDAAGGVVDLRRDAVFTGGEVGAFYGASGGKYGREDFAAHIFGSVGTENFQISGGASYESLRVKVPQVHR